MVEAEEDIVVHLRTGAQRPHLRVHRARRPQQVERLIDQVRAEVEEQATGLLRRPALAPLAHIHLRAPAVEARLEAHRLAERPPGDEPLQRQEVTVPAAVVEDACDNAARSGSFLEPLSVGHARGERLVHHQVEPGLDRGQPERGMLAVRRGDHHQVVRVRPGEQRRGVRQDLHPGMCSPRLLGSLGVRGDDRGKGQAGNGLDERRVERRPGEAVADQPDADWARRRRARSVPLPDAGCARSRRSRRRRAARRP
jgi:hypothetical protein